MGKAEVLGRVDAIFDDILQTASELVRIPSRNPPGEEKRCAEYIHSRLGELGLEAHLVEEPFRERPQVVAIARGKGRQTIILNGHIDTVPEGDPELWSLDPFSGEVRDGFLYGRGAADMKGALAVMIHLARITNPQWNLLLTFAVGEEKAEPGTSTLLSYIRRFDLDVRYGLVLEPTSLGVATCQKGAAWFRIEVPGRAAHASAPDKGVNAIERALEVMRAVRNYAEMLSKKQSRHRYPEPPTCTVTMISGGFKENVIPDRCELVIDRRLVPGESSGAAGQEIRVMLERLDLGCEMHSLGAREPVDIDDGCDIARMVIDATKEATGRSVGTMCFPGATDNEHLMASGIESLVWGPGGLSMAHAVDECISIREMKEAAIAIALLLEGLQP